jgi:hypothetical protein
VLLRLPWKWRPINELVQARKGAPSVVNIFFKSFEFFSGKRKYAVFVGMDLQQLGQLGP